MRLVVIIVACLACGPALADNYPVSGRWGQVVGAPPGPADCSGKRVIEFSGVQRTDSEGGVPGYRNKSVTANGAGQWTVVDYFTTGQIRNGTVSYTLRQVDKDRIEMDLQRGGALKLQKCK